jgi:hypothetical protein
MRDRHGKAVEPDRDEKVKGQKAEEHEATDKTRDSSKIDELVQAHDKKLGMHDQQFASHGEKIDEHHDRLQALETLMGIAKPRDGMKAEDQGSGEKGNVGRGHDTQKGAQQKAKASERRHH